MLYNSAAFTAVLDTVTREKHSSFTAPEARAVADAYGIPVPNEALATSAADAARAAKVIGFPVALRIASPEGRLKIDPAQNGEY